MATDRGAITVEGKEFGRCLAVALFVLVAGCRKMPSVRSPNVLILIADDLALADYREISTPNLDSLAGQGMLFERAYSMPTCGPARASLYFGTYIKKDLGTGCSPASKVTPDHARYSLAKMVKGVGYKTAIFGKWHAGANLLTDRQLEITPHLHGFDRWRAGHFANVRICDSVGYFDWQRIDDGTVTHTKEYELFAVRDAVIDFIQQESGPWLAVVAFQSPHSPFHVPPDARPSSTSPTKRERYELMVESLDRAIGEILSHTTIEETLVIFLGDNGTPMKVAPNPSKAKSTVFERGVRVPTIWAGPGVAKGTTQALAHVSDILETVRDYLDISPPIGDHRSDSYSLVPVLEDPTQEVRQNLYTAIKNASHFERAAIIGTWKLMRRGSARLFREELYDLATDADENVPLDPDQVEDQTLVAALRVVLDREE